MRERFRDKTRDDLAFGLNLLGVRAELSDRERPEEKLGRTVFRRSLGVIDLYDSPVSFINVLKQDGSQYSPPYWWLVLAAADARDAPFGKVEFRTIREKKFPQFWKVTGVTWRGDDYGTGLVDAFTADKELTRLARKHGDVEVRRYEAAFEASRDDDDGPPFEGWTLTLNARLQKPALKEWRLLTAAVERLLAAPPGLG